MTQAVLTPQTHDRGTSGGRRLYWKKLLPQAQINYQGRTLNFTRDYLTDLATAFDQRAYDAVPAVLADEQNRHNMSPERMRGELRRTEVRPDGLWGLIDLTPDAAQLVDQHPDLGVSVRIVEDLERADGKRWPRALQHVLLTADPRVTGMGPWAAVDLAGDQTPVLDLSAAAYTQGAPVALTDQEQRVLDSLLARRGDTPAPTPTVEPPAAVPAAPATLSDDPDEWTTEQVDAYLAEALGDALPAQPTTPVVEVTPPAVPALAGAALSTPVANPGEAARIAALELSVAQSGWREERANWVAAGVPPVLLDRAAPLLSTPASGQVDLSNGQTLDPFQVVRSLLDAAKGTVDLSAPQGSAHGQGDTDPQTLDAVKKTSTYQNWSF